MKTLVQGALLADGTGQPLFSADVLFSDERIERVEPHLQSDGAQIVCGTGLLLTPGFIDAHSHSDFTLLLNPRAEGHVFQGITTEVIGNCGQSAFPLAGSCQTHLQANWTRFGLQLNWNNLESYRRRLEEKGVALNVAPLVGHGNVRACALGYENKTPTDSELQAMERLVEDALQQGAFGISTGLPYLPGTFARKEEFIPLARSVGQAKGVYATHLRSEGDQLLESIEEAIHICEKAGSALQISHLKTWGRENWAKCDAALNLVDQARQRGLKVFCDRYPYLAANTDLDAVLPPWVYEGGREQELLRLQNPKIREEISTALLKKIGSQTDFWGSIVVTNVSTPPNKRWEGISLERLAKLTRVPPMEAMLDLLVEENLDVGALFFALCDENLKKIYSRPYCAVGSDSSARPFRGPLADGKFHPRTYGTFPKFFADCARSGWVPWEEAVRRSTSLPAAIFGLRDRGQLAPGFFADAVLLDPQQLQDTATFENPHQPPLGIQKVWVNGMLVVDNNQHTGKLPGKCLRK